MANFTGNMTAGLSTSDGISLSKVVNGIALNAKGMLDDTFSAPAVVDLAPFMASISDPKYALLLCEGEGANLNFDALGATAKAYTVALLEIQSAPAGVFDLEITVLGTSQRIRFLGLGD
jgi:hypothetical protein